MKILTLLLFIPIMFFAQTNQDRLQKNKAHVDSLLKRVDKASTNIKQIQQADNKRHADSLITVVDHLSNRLNENQTSTDKAVSTTTNAKQYYIVIGAYSTQTLAEINKLWHKLDDTKVIKSRGGKYYYLAIPFNDVVGIQKAVEKYKQENKHDAWWVKL